MLDASFHHQLELREKHLLQLGQQWKNETEPFLEAASWPKQLHLKTASKLDDEDVESDSDDFGPVPDSVFEVDDRHVSFLEEEGQVDEDEVERMVALVDSQLD